MIDYVIQVEVRDHDLIGSDKCMGVVHFDCNMLRSTDAKMHVFVNIFYPWSYHTGKAVGSSFEIRKRRSSMQSPFRQQNMVCGLLIY